jgi:signal transduction histidine kinase
MNHRDVSTHVRDPARLAALRAVALLDTPTEESFDRLARLAARFLRAPIVLVSLVDSDRQFFKSCIGLPEPWRSLRESPLSHSFCQHNRVAAAPLLVEDARAHPVFHDHPAIRDMGVIAYLGIPLVTRGHVLGSFCAVDTRPRAWTADDVSVLEDLAASVMTEIELRTEAAQRRRAEGHTHELENRLQVDARMLQAQKLESLGLMAGGVAHDFNNLLTAMLGYAGLAATHVPPESRVAGMLQQIERAARRASELVQQLLTFAGRARLELRPCHLSRLVDEMGRLLETVVSRRAVLRLDLAPDLPLVWGDPTQLRQVVMNLITNASDALGGRDGTIVVRTASRRAGAESLRSDYVPGELPEGDYVAIEVSDTGCGMSAETLARLFDPFYTTKAEGHGLGLAAILGIVRGHGGTVHVRSEPGRGSTVELLFPAHAGRAAEPGGDRPREDWRGDGTILLAEDEPAVREFVRAVLERAGFDVLEADDGDEAVELFRTHADRVRLALLDLTMPRQTGLDALAEIRDLRPDTAAVVMSGHPLDEVEAADVLQKPFTHAELLATVRRVLERPEPPGP